MNFRVSGRLPERLFVNRLGVILQIKYGMSPRMGGRLIHMTETSIRYHSDRYDHGIAPSYTCLPHGAGLECFEL